MKKLLAMLLIFILAFTTLAAAWAENAETPAEEPAAEQAAAEEPVEEIPEGDGAPAEEEPAGETPEITYDYDELIVAETTPLTGNFFTNMWGNGTSDIDVRAMIHGYNLVEWNTEEGAFVPDPSVVSGITVREENNGNMTFIIALYDDLMYNDGTPVTAWDYAFSMLLGMAPEMEEIGAAVKRPEYLAGYEDYISGKVPYLSGIRVVNDHLLNITIDKGYLPFFYELGLLDCVPYPISVIAPGVKAADDGNGIYLANADDGNDTPVFTAELLRETILDENSGYRTHPSLTSGPYTLASFEDGVATFEINPLYKGDSKGQRPMIRKVIFRCIPTDEMQEAFQSGSVTLLNKVSDKETISGCLALASEQEILSSANYPRTGLGFISFNADKAPLDDLKVRKAIAYITDRDAITEETLDSYGLRAPGYFGIGQWMYLALNGTVNPEQEPAADADAKTRAAYEDNLKKWEELSLDGIEPYDMDAGKGALLLDEAGWNLNENGEAFTPGKDTLRYRETEEGLKPLQLTLAYAKGSAAAESIEGTLVKNLADEGIGLAVEAIAADDLFDQYNRLSEGRYDMFFLATNFDVLYDPSLSFIETEDGHHVWKTSGLEDDELWELAVDMRRTEPDDKAGYCAKWLKFQERIMDQLPVLPVYSNVYFDFYPLVLHEYYIADNISWPQTIVGSYLGDYVPEAAITVDGEEILPEEEELPAIEPAEEAEPEEEKAP